MSKISVFDMTPEHLEAFKKEILPLTDFDDLWKLSIKVLKSENPNLPAIDKVIATVYNETSYSVARDLWQIAVWCEELRNKDRATMPDNKGDIYEERN